MDRLLVTGKQPDIQECFKVYRADSSWLALFTAFRLPSTCGCISCAKEGVHLLSSCGCISCAKGKLQRILTKVQVQQPQKALAQWERLLPWAEALRRGGRSTCEAWEQAAVEFPEFVAGCNLVELFLVRKQVQAILERRILLCQSCAWTCYVNCLCVDVVVVFCYSCHRCESA